MFIEKVKIKSFRVLKDIEIKFQVPKPETRENVVNVVAGVNGTGKSSILQALLGVKAYEHEVLSKGMQVQINNKFVSHVNLESLRFKLSPVPKEQRILFVDDKNGTTFLTKRVFLQAHQNLQYKYLDVEPRRDIDMEHVVETSKVLVNAEFYIKEFILANERVNREPDPYKRTQNAVNKFNAHFKDADLLTRLYDLDPKQFNRPVFKNIQGDLVTIDQLSDGEKQLYGRVIALMILDPKDSIILIDEPEIALHPSWQQKIMQIYASIGENNQFIVATHSPQIIANTPYQNLILLTKQDGKIVPVYPSQPPSGVDINSILSEVMGADVMPKDQRALHEEYRQLVDQGQEASEHGIKVKQEILKRESEHSEFLQEMQFMIELREA